MVQEQLDSLNLGQYLPDFSVVAASVVFFGILLLVFGVFLTFYYLRKQKKQYVYELRWFFDYNGRLVERGQPSPAKEVTLQDGIAKCFYLKDKKELISKPRHLSGDYVFNFTELNNGRYKNFTISSKLDGKNIAEVELDKSDLDYQNMVIKDREIEYKRKAMSFLEKYGGVIGLIVFVVVIAGGFYLLISEIARVVGSLTGVVESITELLREINNFKNTPDAILTNSSVTGGGGG